jgi:hypothetical protein
MEKDKDHPKPEEKLVTDYWNWRGGALIREYEMVKGNRAEAVQFRWIDAILITNDAKKELTRDRLDQRRLTENDEVEFIQAKAHPLGMGLMGQALFSRSLMNKKMRNQSPAWKVKSRRWIALCKQFDAELGALAADGMDVVVPGRRQVRRR